MAAGKRSLYHTAHLRLASAGWNMKNIHCLLPKPKVIAFRAFLLMAFAGTAIAQGVFVPTGSMSTERFALTATLLRDGRVLIAGGANSSGTPVASTDFYNPTTGVFIATGSMTTPRVSHTATLLPDGRVLVAGGSTITGGVGAIEASAEIFDPATGSFTSTGSMGTKRSSHTATLLSDGRVLFAGGDTGSAELYDPGTGTFSPTGNMSTFRALHTATLLPNGKVLILGGGHFGGATGELYDPSTGAFTATGSMSVARASGTATLLANGTVLVTGGEDINLASAWASAEVYDPAAGTFTLTGSLGTARFSHTATLLSDGKVLIAGGFNFIDGAGLSSAELYDPVTGTFTTTGSMVIGRDSHTANLLPSGNVLVAGGRGRAGNLASAEIYGSPIVTILSVSPTSGIQGQTISNFTVTGNNFDAGATLSFSGTGIIVNSYSSRTATQIVANIAIASNAPVGPQTVIVTNPDGQQATKSGAFTVFAAIIGQPAISVSPTQITFPPTLLARTSSPIVVTLSNPGTATLSVTNITAQSPFTLMGVGPLPISISAKASITFTVKFSAFADLSLFVNSPPFLVVGNVTITSNASILSTIVPLLGPIVIPDTTFDPVPDLVDASTSTITPKCVAIVDEAECDLLAKGGRPIRGVAADSVTQIVLRIPANKVGERLDLTLLNELKNVSGSSEDYGALATIGDLTLGDLTAPRTPGISVTAVNTTEGPIAGPVAFAIYRAPVDFVRSTVSCENPNSLGDCTAKDRRIFIRVQWAGITNSVFDIDLTILRPPVILVHGLWESPKNWENFRPLVCGPDKTDCDPNVPTPRFFIRSVNYADKLTVTSSNPPYDPGLLAKATANTLGFDFGAAKAFVQIKGQDQVKGFIKEFKQGQNPSSIQAAAVQADVIAHSMGGNVVRMMTLSPSFLSPDTFKKGFVHKLITIGSPHLGTPLATELLRPENSCVREYLAENDSIAFKSATIKNGNTGTEVHGGVGDLDGPGTPKGEFIGALKTLQSSLSLPTALIAGVMSPDQLKAMNDCSFLCGAAQIRAKCGRHRNRQGILIPADPLVKKLTNSAISGWATLFGQDSDAIVPLTSQYNGLAGMQETAVHSKGTVKLGFGSPHEYEQASHIPTKVIELLNTPVTRGSIFLKK